MDSDDRAALATVRWVLVAGLLVAAVAVLVVLPFQLGVIIPFGLRLVVAFGLGLVAGAVASKEWWPILLITTTWPLVLVGVSLIWSPHSYWSESASPQGVQLIQAVSDSGSRDLYLTDGTGVLARMCRVGQLDDEHWDAKMSWREGRFIIEDDAGNQIMVLPASCP